MADDEHWSDEDFVDDGLADDWEQMGDELDAQKKTADDTKRAAGVVKKRKPKKKAVTAVEDRNEEELSAALVHAKSELLSRAAAGRDASELLGGGSGVKKDETAKPATLPEALALVDAVVAGAARHESSDSYGLYLGWLAKQVSQLMPYADLATFGDKLDSLKSAAKHRTKPVATKGKDTRQVGQKEGEIDVQDRAGIAEEGQYSMF